MELSPQLLTSVTFREQWRGYNPEEVDEFLERVALAVGELQDRLREVSERAGSAESKLLERTDQDEVRRTLVLAQRTAAQAVDEARAEAERLVSDAEAAAAAREDAAERRLAAIDGELAERERRELASLAERRAALEADVAALGAFLEQHRGALRAELETLLRGLDEDVLTATRPPALQPMPTFAAPAAPETLAVPAWVAAPVADEPAVDPAEAVDEPTGSHDAVLDAGGAPGDDSPAVQDEPGIVWSAAAAAPVEREWDPMIEVDGGVVPPGPSGSDEDEDEDEELDPFLAELRRAVTDTEPLGPRDHDPSEVFPLHDAADAGGRFRLRRNRG